jgi:hypothetical protein
MYMYESTRDDVERQPKVFISISICIWGRCAARPGQTTSAKKDNMNPEKISRRELSSHQYNSTSCFIRAAS